MPEGPEVESVVRSLRRGIIGRKILNAELKNGRVLIGSAAATSRALAGRRINAIERHGKFIAIHLDQGFLVVHLGMTGRLLLNAEPDKWTHAIFNLDRGTLIYSDSRQFGRIEYGRELPERVAKLGPEPLEVALQEFTARLAKRDSPIKAVLLNQAVVRGVGNIYADETLFRAGVHPKRKASSISKLRAAKIHASMRQVLSEAIAAGGSSISDYVDADGAKGWFQVEHRAYGRTGEACKTCGTPIKRILLAQRSTHFCPQCQR
jgi:formamidopyrimidine-DNA glycosylase